MKIQKKNLFFFFFDNIFWDSFIHIIYVFTA